MMLIDELITEGEISVFFAFEQSDTNPARISYSQSKCSLRDKIMLTGTNNQCLLFTCGFQDAGLGATGSLLLNLLLLKPTS